jgi:hypothetical protein
MFKLKKISIDEGKDSLVPPEHVTYGVDLSLFKYDDKEAVKRKATLADVDVGWQVLIADFNRYHNTSKIREIVERSDSKVVFKTQTSLYQLEKTEDYND